MSETPAETSPTGSTDETPCPECGEGVRVGMVRCWNCAAFMDPKIEQTYQRMQAEPPKVIYSEMPEGEAVSMDSDEAPGAADVVSDDDDFELSMPGGQTAGESGDPEQETDTEPGERAETETPVAGDDDDSLLEVALQEQKEERRRRKRPRGLTGGVRTAGGFVVFCPYGCRIEVRDSHRGMMGRCPRCRAPFIVPEDPPDYTGSRRLQEDAVDEAAGPKRLSAGVYGFWMTDLRLHTVNPEKLKLKAGSLEKEFTPVDCGFSSERLLLVSLAKKRSGLFGGSNPAETREEVLAHLREGKSLNDLPAGQQWTFAADEMQQLRIVQPSASRAESMFAGVAVFGEGRIAVQLPDKDGDPQFLSFGLTKFREFASGLAEFFGLENLGAEVGIPLQDEFTEHQCHYTDVAIFELQHADLYQADPDSEVVLAGWKCESCGIAITESARAKEKIGGKGGKGIAKAKCPKCERPFGEHRLYTLPEKVAEPSMAESSQES